MKALTIHLGCAGWSVASGHPDFSRLEGTVLERYAHRFSAVEVNSSFYRPHRHSTYVRWAASTPHGFRFSVKVPKAITHTARLRDTQEGLSTFVEQVNGLGEKLGCLLVQLPPSLAFEVEVARHFFADLRGLTTVRTVCEPRHPSWFTEKAEALLTEYRVSRVAADPAPAKVGEAARRSGGDPHTVYYRWHGSPRLYYSAYPTEALAELAREICNRTQVQEVWVIFDNTAAGAGVDNALELRKLLLGGATE